MLRLVPSVLTACIVLAACEARSPEPAANQPTPATERASPSAAPAQPTSADEDAVPDEPLRAGELHYLELVTGGAEPEAELPMIVALHGRGDTPEGFRGALVGFEHPARVILFQAPEPFGPGFSWFNYSAQDGDLDALSAGMRGACELLVPAIAELTRARPTTGKPIVTGFSQGGMLSFALAVEHGELFAAALPVGGWLPDPMWPKQAPAPGEAPPIIAYHGDADPTVLYEPTKAAVAYLGEHGFAATLETYPDVGHSFSPTMHADWTRALAASLDAAGGPQD